jgi:hypothetical protein
MTGPGGSVATQKCQGSDSQVGYSRHKSHRGHVEVNKNNKLDLNNTGHNQNTNGDTAKRSQ